MEKIVGFLNTTMKKGAFTLLCIFLLGISCKKETSGSNPPPPPPPPPPVLDSVSIFGTQKPVGVTENDSTTGGIVGIELGVKFRSTVNGNVVAVKFYKTPGNTWRSYRSAVYRRWHFIGITGLPN